MANVLKVESNLPVQALEGGKHRFIAGRSGFPVHLSGLVALSRVDGEGGRKREGRHGRAKKGPNCQQRVRGCKKCVQTAFRVERGPSRQNDALAAVECLFRVKHPPPKAMYLLFHLASIRKEREREGRARDQAIPSFLPSLPPLSPNHR